MYDLTGDPGTPVFSPAATRLRLSMLAKGVPFIVKEITFMELRREWRGIDKPLGVEEATIPFIQCPDGTHLMDSLVITQSMKWPGLWEIFAPRILKHLSKEDQVWFVSDERLGEGDWAKTMSVDYDCAVAALRAQMLVLETKLAAPDGYFFSATQPNFKDFHVMSMLRGLFSTDPVAAKIVLEGNMGAWVDRMRERYKDGIAEIEARDPVALPVTSGSI
ncbi:hypothetical protein RQP46_001840 [Phenoliferia psychrophenolica]